MSGIIADLRHLWAVLAPWEQSLVVVVLIIAVGLLLLALYWIEGVALMARMLIDDREQKIARFRRRLKADINRHSDDW